MPPTRSCSSTLANLEPTTDAIALEASGQIREVVTMGCGHQLNTWQQYVAPETPGSRDSRASLPDGASGKGLP